MRAIILAFLLVFPSCVANAFFGEDTPTVVFSVDGMDYAYEVNAFVSGGRNVWVPLGELWFWASPTMKGSDVAEVVIEIEDEEPFSIFLGFAGDESTFYVGENLIVARLEVAYGEHSPSLILK